MEKERERESTGERKCCSTQN